MGLRDFQQLQLCLQHLEFNVWEHPNLKVSTLTLKHQIFLFCFYFIKSALLPMLRSKMLTIGIRARL